jgi:signal transduction histidine kinase
VRGDLTTAVVSGDQALVRRLIGNLLDNALAYNRPGGSVDVHTWTPDGSAVLSIANSGPVISADDLESLFEPFRRLGDARTRGQGNGLGLSIVRAIAEAHGATVDAVPRPGGGLAVTVSFPLASATNGEPAGR